MNQFFKRFQFPKIWGIENVFFIYAPTLKGRWRIEQIFGIQNWFRGIKFCWTKTKKAFLALCQFASLIHNFKLAGIFG